MSTILFTLTWALAIFALEERKYFGGVSINGELQHYPYERFEGIKHENKSSFDSIRLRKVEFSPKILLQELESCTALTEIALREVVWTGQFKRKLQFPKLSRIEIIRHKWSFAESSVAEFFDILFFTDMKHLKPLSEMSIIFRAQLGGKFIYFMAQIHAEGIPYDLQQYFYYTELYLEKSVLDISKFNSSEIEKMSIVNSNLIHGSSFDLLHKLQNITELALRKVSYEDGTSRYDLHLFDVSSLKSLEIEGADLIYTSKSAQPLVFTKLEKLVLYDTTINSSGFQFPSEVLTEIRIHKATVIGDGLGFISGLNTLATVALTGTGNSLATKTAFDLSSLSNSRNTLKSLILKNIHLTSTKLFQFNGIPYLEVENCDLDISLTEKFHYIFKNTSHLFLNKQLTDQLLEAVLQTSVSEITIEDANHIGAEHVTVKAFFEAANASNIENVVRLVKNDDGEWEYIGTRPEDKKNEEVVVFYAYICILFLLCILGILGNAISIIVLSRRTMMSSTSCIMIALALFDLTILLTLVASLPLYSFKLVSLFLNIYVFPFGIFDSGTQISLLGENPVETVTYLEEIQSNYIYPMSKTAHTGSVYITVLVTLERFVAVCYPLRIRFWTSKRRAVGMSVLILLAAMLVSLPRWFETKGSRIKVETRRNPKHLYMLQRILVRAYDQPNILQERAYRIYYHGYLWAILMYLIPIPLLTFLNSRIWLQIRSSMVRRRSISNSAADSDMTALTTMLLCVSTCFVLCNMANGAVIWIFVSFGSYDPRDIEVFSCIPIILNSSTNFIFYSILGKKFRAELIRLLRKCPLISQYLQKSITEVTSTELRLSRTKII